MKTMDDKTKAVVGVLVEALESCLAEIVTIAPRVNPQARENLTWAADKAKAALAKAKELGEGGPD